MARSTTITLSWLAALLVILVEPTAAAEVAYCSSQNTGASSQSFHWDWQSNGYCSGKCSASYAFAVISGKDCWCSNYVPADQADTSNCDATCPGFPSEICGSNQGTRFVYFAMEGKQPSGTRGSSQPTSAKVSPSSSSVPASSTVEPSSATTTIETTLPSSAPPSPGSSAEEQPDPETVTQIITRSAPVVTAIPTPSDEPSSVAQTTLRTSTSTSISSAEPVTSNRLVTVSGQVVTETVVITPSSTPAATTSPATANPQDRDSSGPNVGAIAGGAVGGVLGLVAVVGGVFFLLWRRRKAQRQEEDDDPRTGIGRNTSTMSKSGLLRTEKTPQYPPRIATNFSNSANSKRNSRMMQDSDSISPISGSDRRNSRPYLFDQRLNPSAIMVLDNTSRGSFASMDDSRDYGRTLNVRNPDPHD